MDYKALKTLLPGRRLTRIVNTTKPCPLRLSDVLVYSYLVQRATHGKGARQTQISRGTSLHESTAVPKALSVLQQHGLVEKRGVYWWAVEPTPDTLPWFKYRKGTEGQNWAGRFSYWWAGIRKTKARLTLAQTALYFKLLNLSGYGRRITMRGLAALLSVDVKTIVQGVKKLKAEKLVDDELDPTLIGPDQVKWFRPGREKPRFRASELLGVEFRPENEQAALSKPLVDRGGDLMVEAGFSERQVIDYFRSVMATGRWWPVIYSFLSKFEAFLADIQGQHRKNVAAGKYTKAKNCRGLLTVETGQRIKALVQTHQSR